MNKDERDKLRHEVYTLWYHEKDEEKKVIYQKTLELIDYTEDLRNRLKYIVQSFEGMV